MTRWRYRLVVPPAVLAAGLLAGAIEEPLRGPARLGELLALALLAAPPGCLATLLTLLLATALGSLTEDLVPPRTQNALTTLIVGLASLPLAWGLDRRAVPVGRMLRAWWLTVGVLLGLSVLEALVNRQPDALADLWLSAVRLTGLVGWSLLALTGASGLLYPPLEPLPPYVAVFAGTARRGGPAPETERGG